MTAESTCSRCRTSLDTDAPDGFCPACMLEGALFVGENGFDPKSEPEPAFDLPQLGDYQLLEEIARGGMGVVYKARQVSLNRIVAVKLILVGQFADKAMVRRFKAEASAAARLRHPNIVAIHEIGEETGQHFFSMEYVEGPDLAEFIRQQPVSIREAAQLVKTIAEAVHYAHEQGIVHRDLKPSNILIDCFRAPRLTDFGLARDLSADSELTQTGQMLGSPNYISPEQASGEKVGQASDIYALGAILYHLLSGRPPFSAETVTATLQQVATADPVSPRLLNPSVSRDLETICLKCLEKETFRRYSTAAGLARELDRFLKDEPIRARPISAPTKAWRWCCKKPLVAGLAAAFVILLTLGLAVSAWQASARKKALVEARRTLYISQMKAVQLAWDRGDIAEARTMLRAQVPKKGEEDLRGFEWRYYWKQCRDGSRLTITNDFPKQILCIASSPDGSVVAWGDLYGDIHVRRPGDWKPVLTGLRHFGPVRSLEFSKDGRWLVSGAGDRLIRVWDLNSGQEIASFPFTNEWENAVGCVRLSPDGSLIAAGDTPGKFVNVWDRRTGEVIASFEGPLSEGRVVDFSPDGKYLVFSNGDDTVRVWDVGSRKVVHEFSADDGGVGVLKFSHDGKLLASSGPDGPIQLWRTGEWGRVRALFGHENTVTAVSFSRDGRTLASSSVDRAIKVWDLHSFREIKTLYGHVMRVNDLTIVPNSAQIASVGHNTVKLWDLPVPSEQPTVESDPVLHGRVWFARFSPDGRVFVTIGDDDSERRLWEMESGKLIATLPAESHGNSPGIGEFSWDSRFFVTPGRSSGVTVWNATNGMLVTELSTGTDRMDTVTFCGSEVLAGGKQTGVIYRWDRNFQPLPPLTGYNAGVGALLVSPNREILAAWCPIGQVLVRELKSLKFLPSIPHANETPKAMVFSRDSKLLVVESGGNNEYWNDVWEIGTSEKVGRLNGGSATFSLDGRFLATLGNGSSIELWDVRNRRPAQRLTWVGGPAHNVAFSPDSRTLVSCDTWVTLRFWNLTMFREVLTLSPKGGAHTAFSPDGNALLVVKQWRGNELLRASSFAEAEAELAAEARAEETTYEQ